MVNKHIFSDQFQCINSNNQTLPLICIDKNLVCDGTEDCPNGLDEKQDCPEPDKDCGIGKYYCPSSKTCFIICDSNSAATCPEVSDEIKCPPCENEEFQCVTSKMCIGQPLICDGKDDCPDGSDEQQNCEGKQSFLTRSFCERGPRNDYIYP